MYWTANNVMSIIQTVALKQEKLRNYFDIPAMPKAEEVPALKMVNPFRRVVEVHILYRKCRMLKLLDAHRGCSMLYTVA